MVRLYCDTVAYRRGLIEVANVHANCVNVEAWEVSAEWPEPLTPTSEIPDEAIVATTEIELTVDQARELGRALLAAADDAKPRW